MAGLELDPWQELLLAHSLGERDDGSWAAFEVGISVPRQNGKGTFEEARELAGLFLLGERMLIHSAHQFDTSLEAFRRLLFLVEDTPDFDHLIYRVSRSHGEEGIELKSGQRIRFRTRTKGGGRGFTGDLLVLDEAMVLPDAAHAALLPILSARSNSQVIYAGSAVDQEIHEHGLVFARLRERGLKGGDPRLCYAEWSLPFEHPGKVPKDVALDPQAWAKANPGLGIRISTEHIEAEQRSLSARSFAVERLGVGDWPDTSAEVGRVISAEVWAACAEHDRANRITSTPVFAVDVNPDQTWGAIGIGGRRDDKLYQVAVVEHERGTEWIVPACVDLQQQNRKAKFVVDKRGPAAFLIEPLKKAKVKVIEASTEDYGRAFGGFIAEVDEVEHSTPDRPKGLRYPAPQPDLDDALASARKAPMGDAHKWSRKNSTSADITPLVAVTLALWGAKTLKARPQVVDLNAALADAE